MEKEEKIYKVGGIGCGTIFNHAHAPAYTSLYGAKLVGFYDIKVENAEYAKRRFANLLKDVIEGRTTPTFPPEISTPEEWIERCKENLRDLEVYTDLNDLLENVEIIDVCTPPKWHVEYALKALEKNVHAMTEKPPDRTWWQARRLREAAERSKALFQYTDDNVYVESYKMFRHVIESGVIGELNHIQLYRGTHARWHERLANKWFWNPEVAGGGALMDYGSHANAAAWFLAGYDKRIVKVKSQGITNKHRTRMVGGIYQRTHIDDDAHIKVLYEDPTEKNWVTASIQASWAWPLKMRNNLTVFGNEGEVTTFTDSEQRKTYLRITKTGYGDALREIPREIAELGSIRRGIQNFVMCVRQKKKSLTSEEVAIGVMEILGSAYLSELRGRVGVTPDQFKEFCEEIANEYPEDPSSAIIRELMKPYS